MGVAVRALMQRCCVPYLTKSKVPHLDSPAASLLLVAFLEVVTSLPPVSMPLVAVLQGSTLPLDDELNRLMVDRQALHLW